LIDEVRIYNRVLSGDDVKALYQSGATAVNRSQTDTLKNGLVGMWSFDGKFLSRGKALDSSGNNNDGNLTSGPVPAVGKVGQALSFDGVNDYVDAGDINALDNPVSLSACAWVKHNTLTDDDVIVAKMTNTTTGGFLLFRDDVAAVSGRTDTYHMFVSKDSTTFVRMEGATDASRANIWTHVCGVYTRSSATGLRLYVNGAEDANSPVSTASLDSINSGTDPVRIGDSAEAANRPLNGLIDEVRIYNRALTAEEVKRLYSMGR
ncbi:MAG: LamG domain-containing protein, partial [Candidatus Sungbacteria bacterium]|nr:LamG domain-containing protein [Candidatus Sungbacteria bacterium]